jgi:hypothetical protein
MYVGGAHIRLTALLYARDVEFCPSALWSHFLSVYALLTHTPTRWEQTQQTSANKKQPRRCWLAGGAYLVNDTLCIVTRSCATYSSSRWYCSTASVTGRLLGSTFYQTAGMTILNSGGTSTTLSTLWKEVDPRTCVLVSTFFQRVDTYSTVLWI